MSWRHRDILEAELHEPKGLSIANNGDSLWKNENGLGEWTDREVLPAALNFVNGSSAPPTTSSGDIYVISSISSTLNSLWGISPILNDWVRYDGSDWNIITPSKSILCYDKTADVLMVYNGSAWTSVSGGGGGGSSIYTADGTLTGNRILNLGGNNLTFKNTSSTIPSVTLENTNTDHTGILINKTGSLVAGEKASIDFNVSGFFSSKIENIWHGASDISLTLGTLAHLETFRIRNGKVGIKQISPSYDLDVAGEIHSSLSGDAFTGLILENTSANHTALRINKTGSLVAGEKASIDFNVSGYFSSRIQNVWHGSNDMSLIFGTLAHLETFRIRNGKTIANGSNVIGSEGVSLQDDTLIKGSDTSASTSGFKVTDSANSSLLEVRNGNSVILNDALTFQKFNTSYTGFSHKNQSTAFTTGYALIQNTAGQTILNSQTGQSLLFAIGNSVKITMASTGNISTTNDLQIGGDLEVLGGFSIPSWAFESAGGGSFIRNNNLSGSSNYSLYQNNSGFTWLNSSAGQKTVFAIGNVEKHCVESTGELNIKSGLKVNGTDGFTGTGSFTSFTVVDGIITNAS